MALVTYVVVAFVIGGAPSEAPAQGEMAALEMPIVLVAIAAGGSSVLLPRWLLSEAPLRQVMAQPVVLDRFARSPNGAVDPERLRALQQLEPSAAKLLLVAKRWTLSVILGTALADAVALCGLVLAILSRDASRIFPFVAAAAFLMLSHFPRLAPVIERAKQLQRS